MITRNRSDCFRFLFIFAFILRHNRRLFYNLQCGEQNEWIGSKIVLQSFVLEYSALYSRISQLVTQISASFLRFTDVFLSVSLIISFIRSGLSNPRSVDKDVFGRPWWMNPPVLILLMFVIRLYANARWKVGKFFSFSLSN